MTISLHAVPPDLLHLLKRLMGMESLRNFYLVGGTALALRLGHRESVDIIKSLWNVEKSMLYFDDADLDPDPRDLRGVTWEQIKRELVETL